MRDRNLEFIKFKEESNRILKRFISKSKSIKSLRNQILDNPTLLSSTGRIRIPKKEKEFLFLLLASDHLEKEVQDLLFLEKCEHKMQNSEYELVGQMIVEHSTSYALRYIFEEWKSEVFFGWICDQKEIKVFLKFPRYKKIPEKIRRRGYQDHGSRRPDTKWMETSDYSFTDLQNTMNFETQVRQLIFNQIYNYLGELQENWDLDDERLVWIFNLKEFLRRN